MAVLTTVSTPATGDAAMRTFLAQALAAGWTVPSSSDGLTYNASGNQITTDSGAGSFANAGAWARLQQPGGGREILVQRGSTSVLWRVLYSVAPFSGGSPGATRCPTATNQQFLLGGGTDASPTYATLLGTNATYSWLTSFDNASPYECWAAGLTSGTLAASSAIALLAMEANSYDAADADPYAAIATSTSVLAVTAAIWQAHNTAYSNFHAWYRYNLVGAAWAGCAFGSIWFGQGNIGAESTIVTSGLASSASSQELPLPIVAGFRHTVTGTKGRVRGAKYVLGATGTIPNGTHLTDGSSSYWVRVGDLWLQWSSSAPSL